MKRKLYQLLGALFVLVALLLAGGRVVEAHAASLERRVLADTSAQEGLPLPSVPPTLRTVPERAAYVLEHFWDALDFRDTLRSRRTAFMEQNFVNFASLFPHATPEALTFAVKKLMKIAEADSAAYMLLAEMAEKYLCDPESPVAGEEYYIPFLEEMAQTPLLDEYSKERPRYLLDVVRKNARGTLAADFTFLTAEGERHSLHGTQSEHLLLLFMDPDCDHCREVVAALARDEALDRQLIGGHFTVLVVDVSANRSAWQQFLPQLPARWQPCFDLDAVRERELYVWRSLPALYLLDAGKHVLLKEPSLSVLSAFLAEM